uniref:Uncharacterized protein n=1 Tax=Trepomonas sp. PC1 TaxID=1076344 RepID=A0A146K992_9EUKA|eukprot:JAP93157.1 Hypothetical protein TPC1_14665 [Trepomonas sp. PC1]
MPIIYKSIKIKLQRLSVQQFIQRFQKPHQMNFINVLMTVTSFLEAVEPPGSYPYTRKTRECFRTTNELHVDQTNNQMCLHLSSLNRTNCSVFRGGVYYDIFFGNQPAWRTQQRDYSNQTTKFCFPCIDNDCSFSKTTEMVSAKLVNEIYESEIPVGAIVQHRTNTSNCFKQWVNKNIRGPSEVEFKLYIQECEVVLSQCTLTKVVEEAYSGVLLSSYVWDITPAQWDIIKQPQTDQFGLYYAMNFPFPQNNLDNGQIKSVVKLNMQCPNQMVVLDTTIILIQSLAYLDIGADRRATIQDTYIQLTVNGIYPPFDQMASNVVVKVDFNDVNEEKLLNRLTFNMQQVNFSLIYLDCAYFVDFLNPTTQTCSDFLADIISNYLTKIKLNFNFYYELNGEQIYATQTVAAISTGCWRSVDMTFSASEVILNLVPDDTLCQFAQETKTTAKILDATYSEVYSTTVYYCNRSEKCSQLVRIQCDLECQNGYKAKELLFSMLSDNQQSYSEVWVSQKLIIENPFRFNYFMIAAAGTGFSIMLMTITLVTTQLKASRSKVRQSKKTIADKLALDQLEE